MLLKNELAGTNQQIVVVLDKTFSDICKDDCCGSLGDMRTLIRVDALLRKAGGGTMIIVAPRADLAKLEGHNSDDGHMEEVMQCGITRVHHHIFKKALRKARMHTHNDRDPVTGLPLDGAFLISSGGVVERAMIKLKNISSEVAWPGHGTRHDTAFGVARLLTNGCVFVASDSGEVHVITSHGARSFFAYRLKGEAA